MILCTRELFFCIACELFFVTLQIYCIPFLWTVPCKHMCYGKCCVLPHPIIAMNTDALHDCNSRKNMLTYSECHTTSIITMNTPHTYHTLSSNTHKILISYSRSVRLRSVITSLYSTRHMHVLACRMEFNCTHM